MKRTICFLALLSAATSARGELLTIDFGEVVAQRTDQVSVPRAAVFQARPRQGTEVNAEWRIAGLTPTDTGRAWSVTEATAADFGMNWTAVEDSLRAADAHYFRSAMNDGGSFLAPEMSLPWAEIGYFNPGAYGAPTKRYAIEELTRIDFTLGEFYVSPIGSLLKWRHVVTAEGAVVPIPEPASVLLVLIALCHGATSRRSGPVCASQV